MFNYVLTLFLKQILFRLSEDDVLAVLALSFDNSMDLPRDIRGATLLMYLKTPCPWILPSSNSASKTFPLG